MTTVPFHIFPPALFLSIAILVNNAFKTIQQSAKDKEDICRRGYVTVNGVNSNVLFLSEHTAV